MPADSFVRMQPQDTPAALTHAGIDLINARQPLEARARFEEAVRLDRRFVPAWVNLGIVCITLGDSASAASAFLTAAGLDPDSADAQHGLGMVATHFNEMERAELHFR